MQFDIIDTPQSIRDVEVALARYRTLTAIQLASMRKTLTDSQDALARSRALLSKPRSASVSLRGCW